jgi:hypothetical protein
MYCLEQPTGHGLSSTALSTVLQPAGVAGVHSAEWRTIYEDKVAKLYQRVPPAAATLKQN